MTSPKSTGTQFFFGKRKKKNLWWALYQMYNFQKKEKESDEGIKRKLENYRSGKKKTNNEK